VAKPSIGRIVLAPADPATNNGADVAPAIITRVWSDNLVNVRVLLDGQGIEWRTSVTLYDTPDAFAEAAARRDQERPDLIKAGIPFHGVYWPPRV
jgi:hypothetical protein